MGERIILASASPRRQELLKTIVPEFEVIPSDFDEKVPKNIVEPQEIVRYLAYAKAEQVAENVILNIGTDEALVIGADTVVSLDGEILGKPKDRDDAIRMLMELQGRSHEVYSGVSIFSVTEKRIEEYSTFYNKTTVEFMNLNEEEIAAYVDTGEPMDKAGAYAIQGLAAKFISGINGDYTNVVGLPLAELYYRLKLYGICN